MWSGYPPDVSEYGLHVVASEFGRNPMVYKWHADLEFWECQTIYGIKMPCEMEGMSYVGGSSMTIKVGDKVRVLINNADCAGVKKGDIFTVNSVFADGSISVSGDTNWAFWPGSFEKVIEDQITLNGKTWILTRHVDMPTITIDGIVYDMKES